MMSNRVCVWGRGVVLPFLFSLNYFLFLFFKIFYKMVTCKYTSSSLLRFDLLIDLYKGNIWNWFSTCRHCVPV